MTGWSFSSYFMESTAQCASIRMTSLLMVLTKIVGFVRTARNALLNCTGTLQGRQS